MPSICRAESFSPSFQVHHNNILKIIFSDVRGPVKRIHFSVNAASGDYDGLDLVAISSVQVTTC